MICGLKSLTFADSEVRMPQVWKCRLVCSQVSGGEQNKLLGGKKQTFLGTKMKGNCAWMPPWLQAKH